MKILFVTHHRRFKTVARSAPWAEELARRGHEVTLLCIAARERWRVHSEMQRGVRYVETPDLLPGKLRSGWDPWDTLRRVLWVRGERFDLVHAFETRPATIYPVLQIVRHTAARLVIDWNDWWGRGGLIEELRPRWYRWLFGGMETWFEEHYRPRAEATTVISSALAARAERLGVPRERIFRVPGGVDTTVFADTDRRLHRARFGIPADRFVLAMSAADATMDLRLALRAVARAAARVPGLLLVLTGNPPADFAAHVEAEGVGGRVRHLGFLPYEDVPRVLSTADLFLMPFTNRIANVGRWPHKIGEYMASGRPTISNPIGDIPELFEREAVGLLAPETPAAMADAIVRLREDAGLRESMGARARRVAVEQFAWSHIVDRVEQCYASLPCGKFAPLHPPLP